MTRPKDHKTTETEARLQQAIAVYKKDPNRSLRSIARDFKVTRQTLKNRLDGKPPHNKAQEQAMHLTHAEEKELVHWITTLTERGYTPRYRTIRELAEIIRNRRVLGVNDNSIQLVNYEEFGKDWVARFMSHHPQLASRHTKCIEASRIKDVSVERLIKWFEDLDSIIKEYNIEPENIYDMDESGFAIGDIEASQRIINVETHQQFQAKPGRQEWITGVECICADGTFVPPLIIFKGETLSHQWIPPNISNDWRFGCNSKGWTSNERGNQWLRTCFEPSTREKANGKPRLLICDGHDSHITAAWIEHSMTNNIILMVLPPHSSHLTQPLYVGVFGPLKTLLASAIEPLVSTEVRRILKAEWLSAYVKAHEKAFTAQNIKAGFRATGIFPFNPLKVINRIKSAINESTEVQPITPVKVSTPFTEDVLTSSPLNTDEERRANAALQSQIAAGGVLSTPARNYASCRAERLQVRNIIIEEQHEKLKSVVTKRKAILSGKRKSIDGKHILTTSEIYSEINESENKTKKRKVIGARKGKRMAAQAVEELSDELEASEDESLAILDCIEVEKLNN